MEAAVEAAEDWLAEVADGLAIDEVAQGATIEDLTATMRHAARSPTASGVTLSNETAGRTSPELQHPETEQTDPAAWISENITPRNTPLAGAPTDLPDPR